MTDFEPLLKRWLSAGVLNAEAATRIRAYESEQTRPAGIRWQGMVALILGAILLACGVVLFVSAHWDQISPVARYVLVVAMVAVFHLGGGLARKDFRGLSTALHAVGTVSTGAAIALVGQIFNIEEHWPAAILLWAIAALAGWILLRDEAQQILSLLLFPAWILSEFSFYANGHIGENVYQGRFLIVWAILYLTMFLGSQRKAVQGILFAVAAIASVVGIVLVVGSWTSWNPDQTFLNFGIRFWGWTAIALLPLFFALFRFRKSMVPVAVALVFSVLLPGCSRIWTDYIHDRTYTRHEVLSEPNVFSHILVAGYAVFIIWWGVRQGSRSLVNLGVVGFAIVVGWFYFSNIFDEVGRSLGLIGLGILFLAGGWALEKMRRRILAGMGQKDITIEEAK